MSQGGGFTMGESFGRSAFMLRPDGRLFPVTMTAERLESSLRGASQIRKEVEELPQCASLPPSLQAAVQSAPRSSSLRSGKLMSELRGAPRLTVVTISPRSLALGFGHTSPGRQVGWQDEVDADPGLATPLILSDTGSVLAMSPMLHVQLRLG